MGRDDGTLELWNLGDAAAFASQRLEQAPTPLWETCLQVTRQQLEAELFYFCLTFRYN